jgi:hypothetical protein
MAQELKYQALQEIAKAKPELFGQLLELQDLAEKMGGNPEDWIAFALEASALGQAYVPVEERDLDWLPDGW